MKFPCQLYLIEILHQTTTLGRRARHGPQLYLIEILHQTTTVLGGNPALVGCILSKFYIKPQLKPEPVKNVDCCILSKFYIKPQLEVQPGGQTRCCILSKFYIKPQPGMPYCEKKSVVSYRNSTSNHNVPPRCMTSNMLYLIEILHQTTTLLCETVGVPQLYLIEILHQTTTLSQRGRGPTMLYLIEILHQTTTLRSCHF